MEAEQGRPEPPGPLFTQAPLLPLRETVLQSNYQQLENSITSLCFCFAKHPELSVALRSIPDSRLALCPSPTSSGPGTLAPSVEKLSSDRTCLCPTRHSTSTMSPDCLNSAPDTHCVAAGCRGPERGLHAREWFFGSSPPLPQPSSNKSSSGRGEAGAVSRAPPRLSALP